MKKWDETNTPFDKLPFLKMLYKQKKWSFITDYIRLYAIYKDGGIYVDTDIEMVKSFDSLLKEKSFVGFQSNLTDSKYPLNSAVIGSEKGNNFILDCIKETERKQRLYFNAMGGPPIVSKVLLNYGLKEYKKQHIKNVLLLPIAYFYPFPRGGKYTDSCIKEETLCIHWWEDSWGNKQKGFKYLLDSLKRKIIKLPLLTKNKMIYFFNKNNFYLIDKI
ncbi:glycosyltransferase [Tenacibaculum pacificus]|nr:glycosyltransferase [Tenacibaculum pacificus]WBX74796.1 glycosyltransferase [Tenacibaculum pacificus]